MDDSQDPLASIVRDVKSDVGLDSQEQLLSIVRDVKPESMSLEETLSNYQNYFNDYEREIQTLERDIRSQKESSMNAKTAITFDQLKKIHFISKQLGPQKEKFFDRVCRAAEIQRASLKNRLKQNKDRFEPVNCLGTPLLPMSSQIFDSQADSQNFIINPTTQALLLNSNLEAARRAEDITPIMLEKNQFRVSAERQYELLVLGFSFTDLECLNTEFNEFEEFLRDTNVGEIFTNEKVMESFARFLSSKAFSSNDQITLLERSYILLQLGNKVEDVDKIIKKERRKRQLKETAEALEAKRLREDTPLEDTVGSLSPTLSAPSSEKRDDSN